MLFDETPRLFERLLRTGKCRDVLSTHYNALAPRLRRGLRPKAWTLLIEADEECSIAHLTLVTECELILDNYALATKEELLFAGTFLLVDAQARKELRIPEGWES